MLREISLPVVVLIQRVFRPVCEKEMRRIGQENESVYSNGKHNPRKTHMIDIRKETFF